ncbi:putative nuclease HARBI1 [Zeugodacus cucurbitae]|uniref:putative nuclease HARBI1 n=1 Tax=Zeugodacus cucurbitae TaxID=28588 RepID=UPI0023D908D1|nr:putative nuclease HARBI1 [Zeugodacus cucurbitae]
MARAVFVKLENALIPFWSPMDTKYSLKQSQYISLWKLGNSRTTYRELSDRFDVGKGTSHKLFFKTIKAICCLNGEISWPTVTEQQQIMERFQTIRANSFPFVIGCMDGIHFKINTPKHDAISNYDSKGVHSMIMQAICDSKLRFLDVFIGFPGSCHDGNVWKSSPIFKGITSGEVPIAGGGIILADSAYPLSKYLIVPFRDNGRLTTDDRKFNHYLSSTRVLIEQAFGVLRQKFKILNHIDVISLKRVSKVMLSSAILHNFIINNDEDSNIVESNGIIPNTNDDPETENINNINDSSEGISRRNELKMLFTS